MKGRLCKDAHPIQCHPWCTVSVVTIHPSFACCTSHHIETAVDCCRCKMRRPLTIFSRRLNAEMSYCQGTSSDLLTCMTGMPSWLSGSVIGRINKVTVRQAQLVLRWETVGIPSWYETSHIYNEPLSPTEPATLSGMGMCYQRTLI